MPQKSGDLSLYLRLKATAKEWISQVKAAEKSLRDLGPAGRKGGREAAAGVEEITKSTRRADKKVSVLARSLRGVSAAIVAKFFVDTGAEAERLAKAFELVTGSADKASDELEFVRSAAADLGLPLRESADAYLRLAAASRETALEGQPARDIFLAVSNALARLGATAPEVQGALTAVEQIISKGTVSAEELRGQLGERLPGAFQIAARALGVTTAELGKLLEQGALTAEDLLPALAAELNKTFGSTEPVETFTASLNRFWGALKDGAAQVVESTGLLTALSFALEGSMKVVTFTAVAFVGLSEKIKASATALAEFFKFMTGKQRYIDFKRNVEDAFDTAEERIAAAADRAFGKWDRGADDAGRSADEAADAVAGIGGAADTAGDKLERLGRRSAAATRQVAADAKRAADDLARAQEAARRKAEQALGRGADAVADYADETVDQFQRIDDAVGNDTTRNAVFAQGDAFKTLGEGFTALRGGDIDGAFDAVERGTDIMEELAETGELNEIWMNDLGARFKRLASDVAQARIDSGSLFESDATLEELGKVDEALDGIRTVAPQIDTTQIEQAIARLTANAVQIPVVFVPQNGAGGAGGITAGQADQSGITVGAADQSGVTVGQADQSGVTITDLQRTSRATGSRVP